MSEELDQAVLDWLYRRKELLEELSAIKTLRKRRSIVKTFQWTFKASNLWLSRWKGRHNVGFRRGTNDSQKCPDNYLSKFTFPLSTVGANLQLKHSLNPFQVTNMTRPCAGLTWWPMQPTTFVEKDSSILHMPKQQERVTVALACHGNGGKLPALLISKEQVDSWDLELRRT